MTDIFISYARQDSQLAHGLAEHLKKQGFLVWWDREILASDDFYDAIANALAGAKVAIVIWTQYSSRSLFVRDEARYALVRKKLVSVKSTELPYDQIPFGFQSQHTDDIHDLDRIIAAVMKLGAKPLSDFQSNDARSPSKTPITEGGTVTQDAVLSLNGWTAFWRGFSLNVPDFVLRSRSTALVSGIIAGSLTISVGIFVAIILLLVKLRSRNVGTDLENFVGLAMLFPWYLNLKTIQKLLQQRAFKSGWALAVFWALYSCVFAVAVVYCVATLMGEADIEQYEMGRKILTAVSVLAPIAALAYVYSYSRRYR